MSEPDPASNSRLSRIETLWSVVRHSQDTDNELCISAQQQLLGIYGNAIKRYLLAALRDEELADDMFQEFALSFIQGKFQNADAEKGKFRSFVKTVLYRMVALHYRKKSTRKEQELSADPAEAAEVSDPTSDRQDEDQQFHANWRDEILDQAWSGLENHENESGTRYFTILNTRVNEPELTSEEFAARLSTLTGKTVKPGTARVNLHRAREKFAMFVIESVAQSLEKPNRQNVEEELIDLQLIEYCRDSLDSIDE